MTHERGEYLRRLGIEHFAPRRRLPGASEHALYRRAARGGVKSPLPKPALAVSEEPSTMSSAATSPQRMTSNESAMPPHSPRLSRFALLALRSNDLLLVDTLPAEATTLKADYRALLADVLLACGIGFEVAREAAHGKELAMLRWPPKAGIAAADEALAADYIASSLVDHARDAGRALLLGAEAMRFAPVNQGVGRIDCESSLHDLLRDWRLKEPFQRRILPMMRRPASTWDGI